MNKLIPTIAAVAMMVSGCETATVGDIADIVGAAIPSGTGQGVSQLTTAEIVAGLKEALKVGAKNASNTASRPNGFYGNPSLRIPFPQDAIAVKNFATKMGLGSQVQQFEQKLNAAAEESRRQGFRRLHRRHQANVNRRCQGHLTRWRSCGHELLPPHHLFAAQDRVSANCEAGSEPSQVAKYWQPLARHTTCRRGPGRGQVNPDLEAYVTERAVQGLFLLIASEEKKIRDNPAARVTAILRKVFGSSLAR